MKNLRVSYNISPHFDREMQKREKFKCQTLRLSRLEGLIILYKKTHIIYA